MNHETSHQIGIYISTHEKAFAKNLIKPIEQMGIDTYELDDRIRISPHASAVMIVGGDGTNHRVMQKMYQQRHTGLPTILTPGGTKHVLYNELVQRGAVVELEQLPNALTEQSSFVDFYPGQAAGKIFNIEMDQGQALVPIADFNEFLRSLHMPSNLRSMGAALMAYLHLYMSYDPGQPLLDMYSLGPQFGHNRLFPEQELFSQEIVHTLLEGGTKGEAMRLLWQAYQWLGTGKMGEELSEKLIIEQDSAFNTRFSQQHWADGDAYDQAIPESFLHRTNIQFRIAALQL